MIRSIYNTKPPKSSDLFDYSEILDLSNVKIDTISTLHQNHKFSYEWSI